MRNIDTGFEPEIAGLGKYLPPDIITNQNLERSGIGTTDEWIRDRTGIVERRISRKYAAWQMAVLAAQAAINNAHIKASQIERIIFATISHNYRFPSAACLVGAELGIQAEAMDIGAGCSGFLYGLDAGTKDIESGRNKYVLVIGAERISEIVDWKDRNTCILFGDGAGAAILRAGNADVITRPQISLGADGSNPSLLWAACGDNHSPDGKTMLAEQAAVIHMDGKPIFRKAVAGMSGSTKTVLKRAKIKGEEINLVIPHQANLRIIEALKPIFEKMGIRCPVFVNVDRYGNTSAASIPIALTEAVEAGAIREGDRLILTAFGAGVTWGSIMLRWRESLLTPPLDHPSWFERTLDRAGSLAGSVRGLWTPSAYASLAEVPVAVSTEESLSLQG